jgi:hypothetical protein
VTYLDGEKRIEGGWIKGLLLGFSRFLCGSQISFAGAHSKRALLTVTDSAGGRFLGTF